MMSPVNPARIVSRPAWSSSCGTGCVATISPSRSYVSVVVPSWIFARYTLSDAIRYSLTRVAWPTHTSSTPVANGSSVPACPTRLILRTRRIQATTSCEVQPCGLSMFRMPFTFVSIGDLYRLPLLALCRSGSTRICTSLIGPGRVQPDA